MSLADIQDRTAARKLAGAPQAYPEHAGKAPRRAPPPRPVALPVLAPCVHEGQLLELCHTCKGADESRHVRECDLYGDKCTRAVVSAKVRACATCPDHVAHDRDPARARQ